MFPSLVVAPALLLALASLAGLAVAVFVVASIRRRRNGDHVLQDSALSTLVFPPESKFRSSVLPRQ